MASFLFQVKHLKFILGHLPVIISFMLQLLQVQHYIYIVTEQQGLMSVYSSVNQGVVSFR